MYNLCKVWRFENKWIHKAFQKSIEYDYEIEEISSISLRNQKLNNHLTLIASIEAEKVEQQILNSKETLHLIEHAQLELVRAVGYLGIGRKEKATRK